MFRNKRIFIFGGVFVSLCILFLVHGVKSSDKNKEKYFISIEKHSDGNSVNMTIKKHDNKTVVNTCQLEKKNYLTNDKFQNVYSLQDNDIAEILSNSECEFLDENNKKVNDKSLLAIGTLERIHNPILRFLLSWIFKYEQYVIYCDDANSVKVGEDVYGLFEESKATKIEILSCGDNITDMSCMFSECSKLITIKFSDKINTDKVTDMQGMFYNCSNLKELNLSSFNTNNVTDMSCMFWNCSSLTDIKLSNFNTENVTNMGYMFCNCSSLTELDLSKFNTENVKDMSYMFCNCNNLIELVLSNFNTEKVEDVIYMFYYCFKNEATLICKASTIQKITDDAGNSRLSITNENENNDNNKKAKKKKKEEKNKKKMMKRKKKRKKRKKKRKKRIKMRMRIRLMIN